MSQLLKVAVTTCRRKERYGIKTGFIKWNLKLDRESREREIKNRDLLETFLKCAIFFR
jgi:hypothetical protein